MITLCPKYFINDAQGDSYSDITSLEKVYVNKRITTNLNIVPWGFVPFTRNKSQFNQLIYCNKLNNIVFRNSLENSNNYILTSLFSSFEVTSKSNPIFFEGDEKED